MSRILLVEDEQHIAEGIAFNLEAEGHEVTVIADGAEALAQLLVERQRFDVVVLDVMLPGKNGFEVARELRAAEQLVPILMLTARSRAEDVLRGFESGADDYVPKPFELSILIARVHGLLRRGRWQRQSDEPPEHQPSADTYSIAGKTIDFDAMEVVSRGRAHQLTRMECDLLRYLIRNAGKAVSRKAILEEVWGLHEGTDTRAIDNFVVRLRRYLEDNPAAPELLLTVRGVGYKLVVPATPTPTASAP